ncbi:DMT family transporter [Halocella sp. SP3-1]|uniref:DMT family transporter n=1 Tax=Halocella sp. SP3-1 TaxID=2382161 RepID=UPI000F753572|nr:DMT family transporter [Halocella sp. SP3-1]AZO94108.1 EamA family transporter [Halocella sp. SP3-1]
MCSKRIAVLYVLAAASLWASVGIFVNLLARYGITTMQLTLVRCFVTMVVLTLYILLGDKSKFKIDFKDLKWFLGTGIISILFFNFCYMKVIQLVGLSVAAVLLYTSPIMVMFFSLVLFKEKITFRKILAVIFSFIGCVLVTGILSGSGEGISISGLLFGLGAGLCYALYNVFIKFLVVRFHLTTVLFYTFAVAAVGSFLFVDFKGLIGIIQSDNGLLLFLILAGLVTNAFPYVLYTTALKDIEASKASVIASIEPIVATLNGVIFFSEQLSVYGITGILCIVSAVLILNFKVNHKAKLKCSKLRG